MVQEPKWPKRIIIRHSFADDFSHCEYSDVFKRIGVILEPKKLREWNVGNFTLEGSLSFLLLSGVQIGKGQSLCWGVILSLRIFYCGIKFSFFICDFLYKNKKRVCLVRRVKIIIHFRDIYTVIFLMKTTVPMETPQISLWKIFWLDYSHWKPPWFSHCSN